MNIKALGRLARRKCRHTDEILHRDSRRCLRGADYNAAKIILRAVEDTGVHNKHDWAI